MPLLTDYHWHTPLCHHATGPMEAYVERAIELGLESVGFSCHNPLPRQLGADVRMREQELDYYVQRVRDLQFEYRSQIEVLLGLEMDYVAGLENWLAAQVAAHPWDYVIGSIHYLDPECRLGSWSRRLPFDARERYARYFRLLSELTRSGLCDIIAHLDVPKRSGEYMGPAEQAGLQELLALIAHEGVAMEINTSGYRHPDLAEPEPYPSWPIIGRAITLGVPLVVCSDAHAPEQVGFMFERVRETLANRGCREVARFHQRRRTMTPLIGQVAAGSSDRHVQMM